MLLTYLSALLKSKKMKLITLFLILVLTGLFSCKSMMLSTQGVHQPKKETTETLLHYLQQTNGPVANNFIPADSVAWKQLLTSPYIGKEIIGTYIFNHNGFLLNTRDSGSCQWSGVTAIARLHPDSTYQTDTSFRYQQIEPLLMPLIPANMMDQADPEGFTVIMTWAKFMGKFNNRIFFAREELQKNHQAKIRLIFVNIDMQESWNLRRDQVLKIH